MTTVHILRGVGGPHQLTTYYIVHRGELALAFTPSLRIALRWATFEAVADGLASYIPLRRQHTTVLHQQPTTNDTSTH